MIILLSSVVAQAAQIDFVREVQPIFEKHCYKCHGPEKQKGGYRLDVKDVALHGGDNHSPNILVGKSAESPLFRFISGADEKIQMPPVSDDVEAKLKDDELQLLKRWIDQGANWPNGMDKTKIVDRMDWWSFKALRKVEPPKSANPIDAFIRAKLAEKGLSPAPEADPRTLIRRLYFDLIGLPPSPEEVAAFEKSAIENPQTAIESLVDRLLDSPRYGERWARHWLDVVHFGETHGYDKDKPRPNAWPYRDYVIRAFNEDKPYAQFVQEQIAGDVLFPGTVDGIVALGFIAAGPWDLIGHAEVPETKTDGKIARHLDRDDMVQNTIGTFCSLTVGCAQCHNHKFDPITQEDYYSLQAVFAAVDRADKPYFADGKLSRRYAETQFRQRQLAEKKKALNEEAVKLAGTKLVDLDKRITEGMRNVKGNTVPQFGYHSAISTKQETEKWVQVDLGQSMEIDKIVLMPCYDDFNKLGAGFGFPVRFKIEVSDDPTFKQGVVLVWRKHDATFMQDFPNPGLTAFSTGGAKGDFKARYVRVTAVKLAPRSNDYIFALAELKVFNEAGKNLAEGAEVTSLDSIEASPRWAKKNLTDGHYPMAPEAEGAVLADLRKQRVTLLDKALPEAKRKELSGVEAEFKLVSKDLASFPKPQMVYAATVHFGTGAFTGTGPTGGKPRVIHLLKRGDVKTPAQEVRAGTIAAIAEQTGAQGRFELPNETDESSRRAALASWITDKQNTLTWRSIVNRVWQYHFGKGLVETPNDFGHMGGQPSHPELLDWLAATFRDDLGGSIKKLHRLIVTSATYRQSSSMEPGGKGMELDAGNTILSRQNRRKLDAESVHDSILTVSGKLDLTMGGPSYQDFTITHPEHSPHYEYQLHDPEDPKSWRRSIYRFIVRSQQQPFMTVLDCADPSIRVDKRNESLSALQALAMMNNGLMVTMAKHFAERVSKEANGLEAQVQHAFELALSRAPTLDELAPLINYAKKEGLENTCRVILNLNEFSFVD